MSDLQATIDFVGKLKHPIPKENLEDFRDKLYNDGEYVFINNDGTLIYHKACEKELYHFNLMVESRGFYLTSYCWNKYGLEVTDIKPFVNVWYNGAYSDLDMMSVEDFEFNKFLPDFYNT